MAIEVSFNKLLKFIGIDIGPLTDFYMNNLFISDYIGTFSATMKTVAVVWIYSTCKYIALGTAAITETKYDGQSLPVDVDIGK